MIMGTCDFFYIQGVEALKRYLVKIDRVTVLDWKCFKFLNCGDFISYEYLKYLKSIDWTRAYAGQGGAGVLECWYFLIGKEKSGFWNGKMADGRLLSYVSILYRYLLLQF